MLGLYIACIFVGNKVSRESGLSLFPVLYVSTSSLRQCYNGRRKSPDEAQRSRRRLLRGRRSRTALGHGELVTTDRSSETQAKQRIMLAETSRLRAILVVLLTTPHLVSASGQRPVYNIYHMVNAIWQVDEGMELDANAIESDVAFDSDGTASWFYHGVPCDCFRWCNRYEKVPALLRYLRRTTDGGIYEKRLTLLFLDLKTSSLYPDKKYVAGVDIARNLLNHLWLGVPVTKALNVLLAVPSVDDAEVFRGAVHTIHRQRPDMIDKIGFDITNNEDLNTIEKMYRQLGIRGHRWQGDGITNCLSFLRPARRRNSVVANRDEGEPYGFVEKAYQWTIDIPHQLRLSLRNNVDGIITNRPDRLAYILKEKEFRSRMRLANVSDSPWTRFGCHRNCESKPFISMDVLSDDGIDGAAIRA
ncbi:dermonecrotic toxin LsaSicTox-alphaIB2i-like isoform X2 [Dermacentor andersoni]|uniref:dermonecrotic toxin LsaSicTox-alphaIB2i-like isoform X2 n=1 Tax=Dermacentor andersoni TaxID=34620 RepID=UPI003B3B1B02